MKSRVPSSKANWSEKKLNYSNIQHKMLVSVLSSFLSTLLISFQCSQLTSAICVKNVCSEDWMQINKPTVWILSWINCYVSIFQWSFQYCHSQCLSGFNVQHTAGWTHPVMGEKLAQRVKVQEGTKPAATGTLGLQKACQGEHCTAITLPSPHLAHLGHQCFRTVYFRMGEQLNPNK